MLLEVVIKTDYKSLMPRFTLISHLLTVVFSRIYTENSLKNSVVQPVRLEHFPEHFRRTMKHHRTTLYIPHVVPTSTPRNTHTQFALIDALIDPLDMLDVKLEG